jgi:putative FmdB family regulatory protein
MPNFMPIYEYRCENDHRFEAFQAMADDPLDTCEVCGAPAQRVLSAPAVHFKGSGFYTTDYARKGKSKPAGDGGSSESKSEKKSEGSGGSDSKSKSEASSK